VSNLRVEIRIVIIIRFQPHTREHDHADRFVQRDPILDPIPKLSETDPDVVLKVGEDVAGCPSSVTTFELGREIPVEEGDEGGDTVSQEGVDELVVVGDSERVDGVVLSTCSGCDAPDQ
jgi:hypothetical protein